MSAVLPPTRKPVVHYPDSDGQPMADNTAQFNWIALLKWNAEWQFRGDPAVFVAGDHLVYPVEGDADVRQAPDVYVAFGPRKGDRGSYKVWEEGGVFPQVVFEVWSPNNRQQHMEDKREFYERFGAEEYFIVYPEFPSHLECWRRDGDRLVRVADVNTHVSTRLGWRFRLAKGELTIVGPTGEPLRDPADILEERDAERRRADKAEARAGQAEARANQAEERADEAEARAAKLAAKLRELGIDPDAG